MDYQIFEQPIKSGQVSCGYTYRSAGKLKTNQSILNFLSTLYSHPNILVMNQEHTNKVSFVNTINKPVTIYRQTDGLFYLRAKENIFLVVKTADCLPILVWDQNGNLGVAHAGWRGSLNQILINLLQHFLAVSAPNDISIFIGPSIGACCYPIYDQRLKLFQETFPNWQEEIIINFGKQKNLDLRKLNFLQARKLKIPSKNIEAPLFCTSCQTSLFFSYRKEKQVKGNIISWLGLRTLKAG